MLTKTTIKKILLSRANDWLSHLCEKYSIDESEFRAFLKNNDGVCFGSFVIACLLNSYDFDDIDIMIPNERLKNFQVRQSIQKISRATPDNFSMLDQKSLYCPREMCDHCAVANEDDQLFTYHRVHNISQDLRFDIIETKNIKQHLTNSTFDTGIIHFDGVNFHFDGIDLISFVTSPSFNIVSITKGINFEFFYDPWSSICRTDDHLNANYEFKEETLYHQFPKIESQLESLKKIWKDELNCFTWLPRTSLDLPIHELMRLCFSHFRRDKMTNLTTFYKITRLTLRILKNVFRGMKLKNLNEFYLTN